MTDTIFAWAVSLIQCLFDSRSAPLSKFILTCAVAARNVRNSRSFTTLLTSLKLSVCGCCMGKGSYRNTKHKYVIRGFEADV